MNERIGRNDPCPCGSGKKYKKCCMTKRSAAPNSRTGRAVQRALAWLRANHDRSFARLLWEGFRRDVPDDALEALLSLPDGLQTMFEINATEWALADGYLQGDRRSGRTRVMDLLLGPKGPLLEAGEARYLQELSENPLDLYEILEVDLGEGLLLQSLTRDAEPVWVAERSMSSQVEIGQILGLRVIPGDPPIVTGAAYPLSEHWAHRLRQNLQDHPPPTPESAREWVTRLLIATWLQSITAPPPELVDASTGDPILLTEIHYRILDPGGLRKRLEAHPQLEPETSDPESPEPVVSWSHPQHHVSGKEEDRHRTAWLLELRGADRLTVFARTRQLADKAEGFVSEFAAGVVKKLVRETTTSFGKGSSSAGKTRRQDDPLARMSREERTEFYSRQIRSLYANWADQPIPALGDQTPRQAVSTPSGCREVRRLVRSYQGSEHRQARSQDRDPVDFGFLLEAVGLEGDKP